MSTEKDYEAMRRSTRVRAQIPFRVTSLDPSVPFTERCSTLIVNLEGCGVRLTHALEPGLPVLLDELPTSGNATGVIANCVPLGSEGKYWLAGIALDKRENLWCLRPAPPDWEMLEKTSKTSSASGNKSENWPYNLFSSKGEAHPGRR